jgi:hypothetical protein
VNGWMPNVDFFTFISAKSQTANSQYEKNGQGRHTDVLSTSMITTL